MSSGSKNNNTTEVLDLSQIKHVKGGVYPNKLKLDDADICIVNKRINIYVIYHDTFEDTNVFTTNITKIPYIVRKLAENTKTNVSEWKYRIIREEEMFGADMDDF